MIRKVEVYEASDGKRFDTESACAAHERVDTFAQWLAENNALGEAFDPEDVNPFNPPSRRLRNPRYDRMASMLIGHADKVVAFLGKGVPK